MVTPKSKVAFSFWKGEEEMEEAAELSRHREERTLESLGLT